MNSSGVVWVLALALSVAAHWGLLASITGAAVTPAPSPPTELVIEDQPTLSPTLNAPVVQGSDALNASVASPTAVDAVAGRGALSQAPESVIAAIAPNGPEGRAIEHPVMTGTEPLEGSQAPEPRVAGESVDVPRASPLPSAAIDENRQAEIARSTRPAELAPSIPEVARDRVPPQDMAAGPEPAVTGRAKTSSAAERAQVDALEPVSVPSLSEARAETAAQAAGASRARAEPSASQGTAASPEPDFTGPAETSDTAERAQADSAEPASVLSISEARSETAAQDAGAARARAEPSASQGIAAHPEAAFAGPAQESSTIERARSATAEPAPAGPLLDTRSGRDILPAEDTEAVRARADEPAPASPTPGAEPAREAEGAGPAQAVSRPAARPVTDGAQTARREDAPRLEPAATASGTITRVAERGQLERTEPYAAVSPSGVSDGEPLAPVAGRPSTPQQLAQHETAIPAAPVLQTPIPEQRVALAPPQPPVVLEAQEAEPETPALEMASYIREYEGGPCFFALPVALDESKPEIEGFATNADVVRSFGRSFRDRFNIEPKLDVREVTDIQCHAITFIQRVLNAPTPEITVSLETDTIPGGASLNGTVEGVRQGFVILLFVDDEGKVHDVSEYLHRMDRGYAFSAPVTPTGEGAMRDQLIVAIAADRKLGFVRTEVPIPNSVYFSSILKQIVASGADVSIGLSAFRVSPLNLQ